METDIPEPLRQSIEEIQGDERDHYTAAEFARAVVACGCHSMTRDDVRAVFNRHGITVQPREAEKRVRGINSSPGGNRWAECPSAGGAGISSHTGTATAGGKSSGRTWVPGGKDCLP